MASPTSTFATLRALQLVIADALDDIQRVFSQHSLLDPPPSPPSPYSSPDHSPATSPFPATPPASFPPTPLSATFSVQRPSAHPDTGVPFVDYPSPDSPLASNSHSEQLALHPDAAAAASKIVAACGQMSNIVHKPFSSLCDAIMSYNLPACMRLVEHLHVAEILREAEENSQRDLASGLEAAAPLSSARADTDTEASGKVSTPVARNAFEIDLRTPGIGLQWMNGSRAAKIIEGLHVADIADVICSYAGVNYVDSNDLVHALRLLSTHHIFRETAPDTFALTRVASLLDSGKSVKTVFSSPGSKYDDTGGIPAFVALVTDELFKSAAYLTEAFTGVQLPPLASNANSSCPVETILPGTDTIPSTSSFVINDPVPCGPTTRSSSVLTNIVYPEDDGAQAPSCSLPPTEPVKKDALHAFSEDVPTPLSTGPAVLPPNSSRVEASTKTDKEHLHSEDAAKQEKLPAFNLAFRTRAPFFEWLENGGEDPLGGTGQGACTRTLTRTEHTMHSDMQSAIPNSAPSCAPQKSVRLERFSRAMMGTTLWEAPKAILNGFDWYTLQKGSTIIDVGGGIGSTTMILARALNDPKPDSVKKQDSAYDEGPRPTSVAVPCHNSKVPSDPLLMVNDGSQSNTPAKGAVSIRFVVQDRPVVTALGTEAWRSKCPEMLENGQVVFQDHDFFEPQAPLEPPHLTKYPAVYVLRVVLHDWPDECARRILINLRVASNPETRLVIAEHVLPLACADEEVLCHVNAEACGGGSSGEWTLNSVLANVDGAERSLVCPPLLSNLGKASTNAYWMDLLMHITFNGKERTLREFCALALSAGWRVTRMTRPEGTLFAYLVCEPITLPDDAQAIHNAVVLSSELSTVVVVPSDEPVHRPCVEPFRHKRLPARPVSLLPSPILERSSSRCGTPTFGSRVLLPKDEELQSPRTRGAGAAKKWLKSKGLGMRGVMMQKAEKQKEEQNVAKGAAVKDNNDITSGVRGSSPHMRVWWKKSPPNSTISSSIAVHELNGEVPEHRATGRARRGTLKSSDCPSTPSPNVSPVHQKWPSTESTTVLMPEVGPPMPRLRRPSVASITRKLSFATFGRRPSFPDATEPLPPPPHSAALTELAPPPTLQGDTGRSLKHLPSLPTLGRNDGATNTVAERPAVPRRPSFSFVNQLSPPPSVLKSTLPRRPEIADPPKSSILKSRSSPHTSKQSSPDPGCQAELIPRRQRRVTLSNSPGTSSKTRARGAGDVNVPPDPAGPEVKRTPSVPKLPRRLSIPMLRRKQSQSVIQDGAS